MFEYRKVVVVSLLTTTLAANALRARESEPAWCMDNVGMFALNCVGMSQGDMNDACASIIANNCSGLAWREAYCTQQTGESWLLTCEWGL